MPETLISDIPGYHQQVVQNLSAVASDAADTAFPNLITRVRNAGQLKSVYWWRDASQAGATDNTRTLQLINRGVTGTETTVVASKTLTASIAAQGITALTLTSDSGLSAGDILAFNTIKTGNGVIIGAAYMQVEFN